MSEEERAALHSDGCAPSCPACLARDLHAKADAVRRADATLLDELAAKAPVPFARDALLAAAAELRRRCSTRNEMER